METTNAQGRTAALYPPTVISADRWPCSDRRGGVIILAWVRWTIILVSGRVSQPTSAIRGKSQIGIGEMLRRQGWFDAKGSSGWLAGVPSAPLARAASLPDIAGEDVNTAAR